MSLAAVVPDAERVALPVPARENVGAVAAEASVEGGAAVYTIPIPVPPGRRGVQPDIALTYSSRGGNGVVGMGWSLAATSSIYRCPKTVAQDGRTHSVDFTDEDRLCLDGSRLIVVAGVYGQRGSEYRTELDRFARIMLLGGSFASTASYFRVETKAGRIEYYGAAGSQNAIHVPPGAPAPLAWKLRRVEDPQGNSIEYRYGDPAEGHVLTEIVYTGTGTTPGTRRVRFAYATNRPDVEVTYRAGAVLSTPLLLTDIRTSVGAAQVLRYQLDYQTSSATGRSLLARIRACATEACTGPDVTPWTELTYAARALDVVAEPIADAADERRAVRLLDDYDGDGTRDLLVLDYPEPWGGGAPTRRLLRLSSQAAPIDLTHGPWLDAFDDTRDGYPRDRDTDFDRDGVADLVGRVDGRFAIAAWNGRTLETTASNLALADTAHVVEARDFDANGRVDVLVLDRGTLTVQHNCTAPDRPILEFCGSVPIVPLDARETLVRVADLDGNALPDLVLDWNGLGEPVPARILFARHTGGVLRFHAATVEARGGPAGSLVAAEGMGFFDANGDGLLDIYQLPGELWLNTGGVFEHARASSGELALPRALYAAVFPMDVDADGRHELLVPTELVHDWCYTPVGEDEPRTFCSADFLAGNGPAQLDRSLYRWDAVNVHITPRGRVTLARAPTPLIAPVYVAQVEDFHGDGLLDVRYVIADLHAQGPTGMVVAGTYRPPLPQGSYVARNLGAGQETSQISGQAPDLLLRVRDGMQRVHTWAYAPLSSAGVPGCPVSAAQPFYRVDRTAAAPHHYHFTSSLQVVARFTEPDGVGGERPTCYRYEDAMYSDAGRGFQGFRAIIAEQAYESEPQNNLRTTTRYHDVFPLTGRPHAVQVQLAREPATAPPLRKTQLEWEAHCDRGVCTVLQRKHKELTYDLAARTWLHSTITRTTYAPQDRAHGNPSIIEEIREDRAQAHVRRTTLAYDYRDAGAWWLDKLVQQTVSDEPILYKHAPRPDPADNLAKHMVTQFAWHPEASTQRRLLARQTVQPLYPDKEQRADYAYDARGNLIRQTFATAGLAAPRVTRWTYSSGGYFVASEINPAGHAHSTAHDLATGLLRWEERYGLTTAYVHDGFGRMFDVLAEGSPRLHVRRLWCNASCPRHARFRVATVQDGTPIQWQYLDALERVIETRVTGFGGAHDIVIAVEYDARGRLMRESQPSHEPGGAYFTTYHDHDALGRPGRRIVDRSGHAHETVTTTYRYDGATTQLTLPGGLTATRIHDGLGRLVETVDPAGQRTHYRHDAHGNLILIEDSAGNRITARHDELGRRVRLSDPDSGTWTFAYNGAGELISQTDANGTQLAFTYDALGRLRQRRRDGVLEAEWLYDGLRPGTLDIERGTDGFARSYRYDDLLRPIEITTEIDDRDFVETYAYDRYYGRLKAMGSPSGEQVAFEYDAYGYRIAERDPAGPAQGFVYRHIAALTPRGQIARERFGNGLVGTYEHVPSTGRLASIQLGFADDRGPLRQHLDYTYDDPFGNLTARTNPLTGVRETFTYDGLQRLTAATRAGPGRAPVTIEYAYDALGNLTRKDDFAHSYQYGTSARDNPAQAGPHAVTAVVQPDGSTVSDFAYDANGNMVAGNGRTVRYNAVNLPIEIEIEIEEAGTITRFWYAPDGTRYKQENGGTITCYVGTGHERIVTGDQVVDKTYVADYLVIERQGAERRVRYLHRDHLGSVDTITDEAGEVLERHSYDPFGKPLTGDGRDTGGRLHDGTQATATTTRGFTAHEHLDAHRLIHLGGRAYDPLLGRFLSVDPVIQNLASSQNLNPYSYVQNNPLGAVDPTGYQCEPLGNDPSVMTCNDELVPVPIVTDTAVPDNGRQGQGVTTRQTGPSVNTDVVERVLETTARGVASAGRFTWGVLQGIGGGLADMAVGLAHVIAHPVQTAQGLAHAALHPVQTGNAVWSALHSSARSIASGDPEAIGRAALEVGTFVFGAGITKVGKLDNVADAARAADNAGDAGQVTRSGQMHHIATDKSIQSGFTKEFQQIFERAGLSLQDPANKVFLERHAGRHARTYHELVLGRLRDATRGLSGEAYTRALKAELDALRNELLENPDLVRGVSR